MVTQPDAQEKICGPIISPWQHVRHYCVQQLRLAWFHMGNKLNLSTEEQSFFIMQCMEGLLEVCDSLSMTVETVYNKFLCNYTGEHQSAAPLTQWKI